MENIGDCRAGPVRRRYVNQTGPYGVLRIIRSTHKCTTVSSRTGPVAWCHHENSTGVKFLRARHSALRARCRTGAKIRMGSVVGCDWRIRDREQTVRGPHEPRTATHDTRAGFLQILVVSIPLPARKGAVRHLCRSHTGPSYGPHGIWKTLEIPERGPHDKGIARGPCGVPRIIRSNYKCTAISSRTGPVAWCDHENSTGVKFLRARHSTLRARNRTGAKIVRTRGWMSPRLKSRHIVTGRSHVL